MFRVEIDEDKYEVEFDHMIPSEHDRSYMDAAAFRKKFGTVCRISRNGVLCETGSADLSIKDNYNRNVGRKVSLSKALKKLFPEDVHGRRLFWQAYYSARGGKW